MQNKSDAQLLRDYAAQRSELAFAEIVARHTDLVYSAAWRQTGSPELAREIAQSVFTDLARKARALVSDLAPDASLAGWLYRGTRFAALTRLRGERRRQAHERLVMEQFNPTPHAATESAPDWECVGPVLDEAMAELGDADREAVLLRYFKNEDFHAVGRALGVSDDAAQKRVSRAVERLREFLAQRGVTVGTGGLTVVISANAVQAAPIGLAITISTAAALTEATIAATATATVTKAIAMTTLQKTLITTAIAAAVGTGIYKAREASQLRNEVQALRQKETANVEQIEQLSRERDDAVKRFTRLSTKPAPRLPAPRMRVSAPTAEATTEALPSTNLIGQMLQGDKSVKLTAGQVQSYLNENRRSAASLLAAFRTTGDQALLEEAMQKFPNDPQVAFEAAFKKVATPEEQRQWLNALKQSAPQNALADYLSAAHFFKAGQPDQAVQDLIAASGKPQFQDYTLERVQDDEEAYRSAGYSVAEAKTIPSMQLLLPQLAQMKELSRNLAELSKSYRQMGDETSAQAALQMVVNLGQRYSTVTPGEPEVSQLVGIAIERIALNGMDANSPYSSDGRTVKNRLDQLAQQDAGIRQLAQQTEALQSKISDQDWISYKDRWRNFGEEAAGRWLINKYGQK